jgi:YHS domain-containing protein
MGLDPVCDKVVTPIEAAAQSEYEGVAFYFCSVQCKEQFDRDPLQYVDEVDLAEARAKRDAAA